MRPRRKAIATQIAAQNPFACIDSLPALTIPRSSPAAPALPFEGKAVTPTKISQAYLLPAGSYKQYGPEPPGFSRSRERPQERRLPPRPPPSKPSCIRPRQSPFSTSSKASQCPTADRKGTQSNAKLFLTLAPPWGAANRRPLKLKKPTSTTPFAEKLGIACLTSPYGDPRDERSPKVPADPPAGSAEARRGWVVWGKSPRGTARKVQLRDERLHPAGLHIAADAWVD